MASSDGVTMAAGFRCFHFSDVSEVVFGTSELYILAALAGPAQSSNSLEMLTI